MGNSLFAAWSTLRSSEANEQVWQSVTHITRTQSALEGLLNMQTGMRGFLLTGDPAFLEPYEQGQRQYGDTLAYLRFETSEDPRRAAHWIEVDERVQAWQRTVVEPQFQLRNAVSDGSASMEDVVALVDTGEGKRQFDAIRSRIETVLTAENALLRRALDEVQASDRLVRLVLLGSSLGSIILAVLVAFLTASGIAGAMARMTAVAGQIARGDLSKRIGLPGRDEIGQTAAAFDDMANQLQRTLQQSETERATLASVTSSMSDGLVVLDDDRRVRYANPRAVELLKVDQEALIGQQDAALLRQLAPCIAEPEAAIHAWYEALHRTQAQPRFEVRSLGTPPRDLQVQLFPLPAEPGADSGVGVLLRDVTSERELVRTKDEMMSVVSHELRTPLASLVGFTELLLTREFPEAEQQEFLGLMLREGQRLSALINDFLDLQRIESGVQAVKPMPTHLAPVVQRTVEAAGPDPQRPILVDLPPDLPTVHLDAERIQQVLGNLLGNARKYSPQAGPVRLTARLVDQQVEVAIADQGLGIPPEALPRLAETFYRVDNSDRRAIGGTGLGLAISRRIVEAHGGRLWAESAGVGHGSTFYFTVPLARRTPPTVPGSREAPVPANPGRGGSELLVVENDHAYATWLAEMLRGAGYTVRVAATAEEALAAVSEVLPSAILLDLRLDGTLDGWDILAMLRARTETTNLPVVVVSSYEEYERGKALGVAYYLVKPVSRERLLATLRQLEISPARTVLVVENDPATRQMVLQTLRSLGLKSRGIV